MYSWSSYVIYGDGSLQLRKFTIDVTWQDLATSAAKNLRQLVSDPAASQLHIYGENRYPYKDNWRNPESTGLEVEIVEMLLLRAQRLLGWVKFESMKKIILL